MYFGKNSIIANLGNCQSVTQAISDDFNPRLIDSYWVPADFQNSGKTDLLYIIGGGVADPGYILLFSSNGNGTFSGRQWYLRDYANPQHVYDVRGVWTSTYCGAADGKPRLVHYATADAAVGNHTPTTGILVPTETLTSMVYASRAIDLSKLKGRLRASFSCLSRSLKRPCF